MSLFTVARSIHAWHPPSPSCSLHSAPSLSLPIFPPPSLGGPPGVWPLHLCWHSQRRAQMFCKEFPESRKCIRWVFDTRQSNGSWSILSCLQLLHSHSLPWLPLRIRCRYAQPSCSTLLQLLFLNRGNRSGKSSATSL